VDGSGEVVSYGLEGIAKRVHLGICASLRREQESSCGDDVVVLSKSKVDVFALTWELFWWKVLPRMATQIGKTFYRTLSFLSITSFVIFSLVHFRSLTYSQKIF
jgi:hypothetical protein